MNGLERVMGGRAIINGVSTFLGWFKGGGAIMNGLHCDAGSIAQLSNVERERERDVVLC